MRKIAFMLVAPLAIALAVVAISPVSASAQVTVCPAGYTCTPIQCPAGYTCVAINQPAGCPEGYTCDPTVNPPIVVDPTSCYVFSVNLAVGSTGADVVALQTFLISKGFAISDLSVQGANEKGYFGEETAAALVKYQASVGLPSTGYFGPLTRAKVNSDCVTVPTENSFSVKSPVAGNVYDPNGQLSLIWSSYTGDFDYYQLFLGNTLANSGIQIDDGQQISKYQNQYSTFALWPFINQIVANSSMSADAIQNAYYVEVNAVKADRVSGGIVATARSGRFTIGTANTGSLQINLVPIPVPTSQGYAVEYRVTFDGTRHDPASMTIELACVSDAVTWTASGAFEKTNNACTNRPDYNTGVDMKQYNDGEYRTTITFFNASGVPQLVKATAKAWGGVDGKTMITSDADTVSVPSSGGQYPVTISVDSPVSSGGTANFNIASKSGFNSYVLKLYCDPGLTGEASIKGGLLCNETAKFTVYEPRYLLNIPIVFKNSTPDSKEAILSVSLYKGADYGDLINSVQASVKVLAGSPQPINGDCSISSMIAPKVGATPKLFNIDFGKWISNSNRGDRYTGPAIVGNGGDFWNIVGVPNCDNHNKSGLSNADGSPSQVTVQLANLGGAWGADDSLGIRNKMLADFSYPAGNKGGNAYVILHNAPTGSYDLYLYNKTQTDGQNGDYSVNVGGRDYGRKKMTTDIGSFKSNKWENGNQFVVFKDIKVREGEGITILIYPSEGGYHDAQIAGLQLAPAGTSVFARYTEYGNSKTNDPSVDLLSPNGGESYVTGGDYEIRWKAANFPANSTVYLELRPENYNSGTVSKIAVVPAANGYYAWKIPSTIGSGQYRVEIYKADRRGNIDSDEPAKDISSRSFTITNGATSFKNPLITSVAGMAASNGEIDAGGKVMITGSNMAGGLNVRLPSVYIDGKICSIVQYDNNLIYCIAPSELRVGETYDLYLNSVSDGGDKVTSNIVRVKVLSASVQETCPAGYVCTQPVVQPVPTREPVRQVDSSSAVWNAVQDYYRAHSI